MPFRAFYDILFAAYHKKGVQGGKYITWIKYYGGGLWKKNMKQQDPLKVLQGSKSRTSMFYMAGGLGLLGLIITQMGLVDRMPKEKSQNGSGLKEIFKVVSKPYGDDLEPLFTHDVSLCLNDGHRIFSLPGRRQHAGCRCIPKAHAGRYPGGAKHHAAGWFQLSFAYTFCTRSHSFYY